MRNARSVWTIPTKQFHKAHTAAYPPDWIKPCILTGCSEGGTVIDPFFSVGATELVAKQLDRNGIRIEINPKYADMTRKRMEGV